MKYQSRYIGNTRDISIELAEKADIKCRKSTETWDVSGTFARFGCKVSLYETRILNIKKTLEKRNKILYYKFTDTRNAKAVSYNETNRGKPIQSHRLISNSIKTRVAKQQKNEHQEEV